MKNSLNVLSRLLVGENTIADSLIQKDLLTDLQHMRTELVNHVQQVAKSGDLKKYANSPGMTKSLTTV